MAHRGVQTMGTGRAALPDEARIMLNVNGATSSCRVAPWTTLLDALRECEYLDLTGTKKGCDHGQVGWDHVRQQ